jgi:hypothetical protein
MARIELDIDTDVAPEPILAALTDFSERRPDIWPGLNRAEYRVIAVGDTWADVREGNGGPVWAQEHYDWSKPGQVTWTMQDSGFAKPGSFVTAIVSPGSGGGSHIHIIWDRRGRNLFGRLIIALNVALRGAPVRGSIEAGLKVLRKQGQGSPQPS